MAGPYNIKMKKYFQKYATVLVLLFSMLVSLGFRLYGLDWDKGLLFHPDERNIANAVTQIHFFSQLNPHFFAYGGFSIYLYRATGDFLVFLTHNQAWMQDWGMINLIGRFYSALFSVFTILPLYFVAKKLFGRKVGYLSVLFYTFTVTSIQNAHFAVTDSSITFFGILLSWIALWWLEKPTLKKTLLFASVFGVSVADKTSALAFGIFPFFAYIFFFLAQKKQRHYIFPLVKHLLLFGVVSGLFFLLFSPYSLLDFPDFSASMHYESGVATGSIPVPYTLQFTGSIPYLFQIQNFVWQMGPLLTIFTVAGMLWLIVEPLKKKEKNRMLFWTFPLVYFIYVGSWHTKFLRYMLPLIPFLLIGGSFFLLAIRERYKKIGNTFILLTLLTTILWAGACMSIYTHPQTRIEASTFMYQQIPPGSTILSELWDDMLPVPLGENTPSQYYNIQLNMYPTDDVAKIQYLATNLSHAQYIAINSRRIYGTLMRLTTMYPITSNYYRLLFAGKLGYKEIGTWSSYPQLFGITINDDSSEETFQVYDHPKVFLFENTKHYSTTKLEHLLQ